MILCDNPGCKNGKWFHHNCVDNYVVEKGKKTKEKTWFCSDECNRLVNNDELAYTKALLWWGFYNLIVREAIRNGDGDRVMLYWKIAMVQFHNT